jgi:hypothetical protein
MSEKQLKKKFETILTKILREFIRLLKSLIDYLILFVLKKMTENDYVLIINNNAITKQDSFSYH